MADFVLEFSSGGDGSRDLVSHEFSIALTHSMHGYGNGSGAGVQPCRNRRVAAFASFLGQETPDLFELPRLAVSGIFGAQSGKCPRQERPRPTALE